MMENLPSSLSEAKQIGSRLYFTNKPCTAGHLSPRFTRNSSCTECAKISSSKSTAKYYATNKASILESRAKYNKEYYASHKEQVLKTSNDWHKRNRARSIKTAQNWRSNNLQLSKEYHKQWRNKNKALVCLYQANRRAAIIQATPKWLTIDDLDTMRSFYVEAQRLTFETGIKHHVDHIVPLLGRNVRGLHVPWNLQVILKEDNLQKSNKLEDVVPVFSDRIE